MPVSYLCVLILLIFFIPIAVYLLAGGKKSRGRLKSFALLTIVFVAIFGFFTGVYNDINPTAHIIFLFAVIALIIFLAKRTYV